MSTSREREQGREKPRLVLCDGWRGVQGHLLESLGVDGSPDPLAVREIVIVVPTAAAGHLLRNTLEQELLDRRVATVLPTITTMSALTKNLVERSLGRVRLVDPLLREALLEQALVEATRAGTPPPFTSREALSPRILALYDELWSAGHRLEDFVSRAEEEFDVPEDVGAQRMAEQTRFLGEGLRRYREKLSALGLEDRTTVFSTLLERGAPFPYRRALLIGPGAVTPRELSFLTSLAGLDSLQHLVPESMASAHPVRSLHDSARFESIDAPAQTASPTLLRPEGENAIAFVARDREEVLVGVARLLKARAATGRLPALDRIAVVVPSPLPYLYLAKKALGQAGIPYQLQDDFPLATEPYLAASDLVLSYVGLDGRRSTALGLLRSPFFRFPDVGPATVAALDSELTKAREMGGWKVWRRMLDDLKRRPVQPPLPGMEEEEHTELSAVSALVQAAERLAPLADPGTPLSKKVASFRGFLTEYGRPLAAVGDAARHERARGALLSILERLSDAARKVGDPPIAFQAFQDKLHRAIESHTFSTRAGRNGIQIVDVRSVGLGAFEMVVLVGLNEGEWPARSDRNIFYPQWLLKDFGWPSDTELLAAERVSFTELLRLSSGSVAVFRHELEEEIPTVASPFLEEVAQVITGRDERVPTEALQSLVISRVEALRTGLAPVDERFVNDRKPNIGELPFLKPETVSATAFELYLRCPFKYFSRHVLGIEEEEDFDEGMTPMQRGLLVHEILRKGFEQWDSFAAEPRPITGDNYHEAMALFRRVAAKRLPPERRSLEMERLFGGPGQTGEIEWLLRQEMEKEPMRRRLVEYGFQNHFQFPEGPNREKPWFVRIKGRADRIDIDSRGALHVLDYKSGRAPEARLSLQVPLYAMCLEQQLGARAVEASYLSLRERKSVPRQDFQKVATLLKDTYRNVTEGRFAPRPSQDFLCNTCGYVGVCRKEIEEISGRGKENDKGS